MNTVFVLKKQKILDQLNVPSTEYTDASPKGAIDEPIVELIKEINDYNDLVTTSSCSGRFSIYLEGSKDADASSGGKGGGAWLYISHDMLDGSLDIRDALSSAATSHAVRTVSDMDSSPDVDRSRFIRCKFEPMILHILASSNKAASTVLAAAQTAGFRESGISSISEDSNGNTGSAMVAVRSSGLAFDSVIGLKDKDGTISMAVSDPYLKLLVQIANSRFTENRIRTERFRTALKQRMSVPSDPWEPKDVRAARLRAEGLAKKAKHAGPATPVSVLEESDDSVNGSKMLDLPTGDIDHS